MYKEMTQWRSPLDLGSHYLSGVSERTLKRTQVSMATAHMAQIYGMRYDDTNPSVYIFLHLVTFTKRIISMGTECSCDSNIIYSLTHTLKATAR